MPPTIPVPRGRSIRPRHPTFDIEEALAGDWNGGDPFRTAFFNAMSISFPGGERFFTDAIRAFENDVREPALRETIRGFIGQEAVHGRIHQQYNETLCRQRGYDLEELEAPILARSDWGRENTSPLTRLTVTVALEHLTTTLAAALLEPRPAVLDGADPRVAELWRWHAAEEIEHRAVAFSVYSQVGGCPKRLRRTLRFATLDFLADALRGARAMLRSNGHGDLTFSRGLWWLFGWPGVLRRLLPGWAAFHRRGFDPGASEVEALLEGWCPDPRVVSFAADPIDRSPHP